jgi:hypothetical protein
LLKTNLQAKHILSGMKIARCDGYHISSVGRSFPPARAGKTAVAQPLMKLRQRLHRIVDTRTIQSYLGHKSIQHTVRYTELAPTRFKFRDCLRSSAST